MCLTFDYARADAAAAAAMARARHDADCDGVQVYLLEHAGGARTVLCRMRLESQSAVLAMYPVPRDCLGEALVPCPDLACQAAYLGAWRAPGAHVPVPVHDDDYPVYRSLGAGGGAAVAAVALPPARCVANLDGSATFVLATAGLGACGSPAELKAVGDACFAALAAGLAAHGVERRHVFELGADGEVAPGAMVGFLDELLPNLLPGCDMLVAVPPFGADGAPAMRGAFSFAFHYAAPRARLPLLGLVHNDHAAPGAARVVDGRYYLVANADRAAVVGADAPGGRAPVRLDAARDRLPRALPPGAPPDGDYGAWVAGCAALQAKCAAAVWEAVGAWCAEMGLPPFDATRLFATDLAGRALPKAAVHVEWGADDAA